MPTPPSKPDAPEASKAPKRSHADEMLSYRDKQVGARKAYDNELRALKDVKTEDAGTEGFVPNFQNQVPQEGALVENPPQPTPPPYTDAELKEMDHAPRGYREPSVAVGASSADDYDQTVHPESRVNDPRFPL